MKSPTSTLYNFAALIFPPTPTSRRNAPLPYQRTPRRGYRPPSSTSTVRRTCWTTSWIATSAQYSRIARRLESLCQRHFGRTQSNLRGRQTGKRRGDVDCLTGICFQITANVQVPTVLLDLRVLYKTCEDFDVSILFARLISGQDSVSVRVIHDVLIFTL